MSEAGYPVYGANGQIGFSSEVTHPHPVVLVGCRGTCGSVHLTPVNSYANGNAMAIDQLRADVEVRYLAAWLRHRGFRDVTTGSSQPQITRENIVRIEVPLPPIEEQRRIADILDRANALRAKRREALALLDDLAQSIFLDMFGDPENNPRDWPVRQLADFLAPGDRINYGVLQPGDDVAEGVGLVRVGDLIAGRVRHSRLKYIDPAVERSYARSRLLGTEVLVSCVGSIGVVAIVRECDVGLNIARAVSRVPIQSPNLREYLAAHLRTAAVQRYFVNELRTVAQPTLNVKQLAATSIMRPPDELIDQFVMAVAQLDSSIAAQAAGLGQLDVLFSSLQQRAFANQL